MTDNLNAEQEARAVALDRARAILRGVGLQSARPEVADVHSLAVFILDGGDPRSDHDKTDSRTYEEGWRDGLGHGLIVAARNVNDVLDRSASSIRMMKEATRGALRAARAEVEGLYSVEPDDADDEPIPGIEDGAGSRHLGTVSVTVEGICTVERHHALEDEIARLRETITGAPGTREALSTVRRLFAEHDTRAYEREVLAEVIAEVTSRDE